MARSILFICQAETVGMRKGRFPSDEQATDGQLDTAVHLAENIGSVDRVYCAPQKVARDTAVALFNGAVIASELRDIDYGQWCGRSIREISLQDEIAFQSWLQGAPAPGGESLESLVDRITKWLDGRHGELGKTAAVASPAVLRALVIATLNAPLQSYARLDVKALSILQITSDGKRWNIRLTL